MIDQEKLLALKTGMKGPAKGRTLEALTPAELKALRELLDEQMPEKMHSLGEINLEHELLAQYRKVKDLQDSVLTDDVTPANQKAQCAGQVASTLQSLIKMQIDLQRDERLKKIEGALLEAISTLPDEARDLFFAEYEKMAKDKGATL